MTQSVLVSIPQTAANTRREDVKGGAYEQAGFFDHPKIFTSGTVLPANATGNVSAALTSEQRAIVRNFAANACIITPPLLPYGSAIIASAACIRSEERRVGKEC